MIPEQYGYDVDEFVRRDIEAFHHEMEGAGQHMPWEQAVKLYADSYGNGCSEYIIEHFSHP